MYTHIHSHIHTFIQSYVHTYKHTNTGRQTGNVRQTDGQTSGQRTPGSPTGWTDGVQQRGSISSRREGERRHLDNYTSRLFLTRANFLLSFFPFIPGERNDREMFFHSPYCTLVSLSFLPFWGLFSTLPLEYSPTTHPDTLPFATPSSAMSFRQQHLTQKQV